MGGKAVDTVASGCGDSGAGLVETEEGDARAEGDSEEAMDAWRWVLLVGRMGDGAKRSEGAKEDGDEHKGSHLRAGSAAHEGPYGRATTSSMLVMNASCASFLLELSPTCLSPRSPADPATVALYGHGLKCLFATQICRRASMETSVI